MSLAAKAESSLIANVATSPKHAYHPPISHGNIRLNFPVPTKIQEPKKVGYWRSNHAEE